MVKKSISKKKKVSLKMPGSVFLFMNSCKKNYKQFGKIH